MIFSVRCDSGVAALEFALILPLFLALFVGTVELCNYIIAQESLESTVTSLTDVTAQLTPSSGAADINTVLASLPVLMAPSNPAAGNFILTDLQGDAKGNPTMRWQLSYNGNYQSTVGAPCVAPNLAPIGNMTFNPGDEVIIGEGFFPYTTVFTLVTTTLYRTAVFWPRNGSLANNTFGGTVILCP